MYYLTESCSIARWLLLLQLISGIYRGNIWDFDYLRTTPKVLRIKQPDFAQA